MVIAVGQCEVNKLTAVKSSQLFIGLVQVLNNRAYVSVINGLIEGTKIARI